MKESLSRRIRLHRHPQSDKSLALDVEAEVERGNAVLALTYIVRGETGAVLLPKETAPARTDGLWQHTCFETFVRSAHSAADYWEFNFSPSGQWAAYRFNNYREGMEAELAFAPPNIDVQLDGSELRLMATMNLSDIEALEAGKGWEIAIAAVIEDENGGKSWWALAHPLGKPDFHHGDGFVLSLCADKR